MFSEGVLIGWSALGLIWWLVAWRLVAAERTTKVTPENVRDDRRLTIFKPLAPLGSGAFREQRGLESFINQLDEGSELLVGVHEQDRARAESFLARMRAEHPGAEVKVIWRAEPDSVANPKVAWLKILAPHATGELWLWSDADIVAPPEFPGQLRAEYAASGARMVTWPYVIRDLERPPALLDALFVNVEFYPGVLLLRRLGPVDFGLGAAMLFSRNDFENYVGWDEIGSALADDFVMGQKLQPVRIGRALLTTVADAEGWRVALLHYLRWSKTVRWSRPGGTAARLIVLPILGWMGGVAWHPTSSVSWIGLITVMQMDVFFAWLISSRAGCRLGGRYLALIELWSVGRAVVWIFSWLPWPVIWRGRRWWRPTC